ncbi:5'-methylthioadenosine/adenosylhomocysteine nucleosidase [Marinicella rhabdoformis]|uniref:5'-methylthioadenosine/adenosylhomocysteine nucleosidase n=1 Tax=Marinicella rhabdoformis TaxID=2580566 RepID=UPI0012AEC99A|nr:5'-methylthioadenosine/adenosylhomocysteine nucleosidase [Marinicella rhabdoformis]
MKFAIIAAMHEECVCFRTQLNSPNSESYLNMQVNEAKWYDHEVVLIESGIGKVNATLAAQHAIDHYKVDHIINTGSAGGIVEGAEIGDFVIADRVCHHDIDISPIGFEFGELPKLPVYYETDKTICQSLINLCHSMKHTVHSGTIATGDTFVYQHQQLNSISTRFNGVIACEMEAAAVAQVCHLFQKPFTMIRNLSDIAGEHAPINFQSYINQAGQESSQLVLDFIKQLQKA